MLRHPSDLRAASPMGSVGRSGHFGPTHTGLSGLPATRTISDVRLGTVYRDTRRCARSGVSVARSVPFASLSHGAWLVLYRGGMNAKARAMRSEVLALPEVERAELIFDLLDSLDDRPTESDQAELDIVWADETARRANQIDSGELATDSWDDVVDKVVESRRVG